MDPTNAVSLVSLFKEYGPAWMLVIILIGVIASIFVAGVAGIKYMCNLLFSTDEKSEKQGGGPKGLLIPFLNEHLNTSQRTETLTSAVKDACETLASNTQLNMDHAEKMERLMSLIERRLRALDQTNSRKVHKSLVYLSTILLDAVEAMGMDKLKVQEHRQKLEEFVMETEGGFDTTDGK